MSQAVLKQPSQGSTSGLINNNIMTLREIKHTEIQERIKAAEILKQRLIGVLLLLIGVVTTIISNDATAFIFLSIFASVMLFSKECVMTFGKRDNNENRDETE